MTNRNSKPVYIYVDEQVKEESTKILKELNMTMTSAINLFLKKVIEEEGIPFEISYKLNKENK